MTKIALTPNANGTGTFTLAAPDSDTDRTFTLPDATGEVVTADASGNVEVSGGVYLGGTASSNLLDDYEEGTYTPSVTSLGGSITSFTSSGTYTKIGRVVYVTAAVTITNNGTGSGAVTISVPFTCSAGNHVGNGRENAVNGSQLQWRVTSGNGSGPVFTYDDNYPGGTNHSLLLSLCYLA